jgi:hypothetical protein
VRHLVASLVALALLGESAPARAQGNDHSAPTGGRTALMGNSGVALSRDGAAPFLNPATIVRIDDQSLAFSVNFFGFGWSHYTDWHQPTSATDPRLGAVSLKDTAISSTRFDPLPSTLCLFFTLAGVAEGLGINKEDVPEWKSGRQKLALCLGSVESEDVNLPALSFNSPTGGGTTSQVQAFSRRWSRLHIGPTYSALVTDQLALGASLHVVVSNNAFLIGGSSVTSGVTGSAPIQATLGTGGTGHSFDLVALMGATYRIGRGTTLGASVQLPSLHILGSFDGTLQSQLAGAGADQATLASGTGDFRAPPPVRATLGIGFETRALKLELDGSYQFPQGDFLRTESTVTSTSIGTNGAATTTFNAAYAVRSQPVWNMAMGAEHFVSPAFSLIGGLSTNLSAVPPLSPTMTTGNLVQARQNSVAISFGVGSYGDAGDILIGTQLGLGWGQAMAVNPYALPNDWAVVDVQSYSALLILAGATNLRAISKAVENMEHAVTKGAPEQPPK